MPTNKINHMTQSAASAKMSADAYAVCNTLNPLSVGPAGYCDARGSEGSGSAPGHDHRTDGQRGGDQ